MSVANAANHHTGKCCPAIERIADETELSERTVRRALDELCDGDAPLLARQRNRRSDGTLGAYHYTFPVSSLSQPPDTVAARPPDTVAGQEPRREPLNLEGPLAITSTAEIETVYNHWRSTLGKSDSRYDTISPQRRDKIRARLKNGFTVEQLCTVFSLAAKDTWPDRKRHSDITVLLRSHETVDRWLDRAPTNGNGAKPFACRCGQSFRHEQRLAEHQFDVHGLERTQR